MAAHKHAEVIKAWADGAQIEWRFSNAEEWRALNNNEPRFDEMLQYRVKTKVYINNLMMGGYPQTKMSPGDLGALLIHSMIGVAHRDLSFTINTLDRLPAFADAILKCAVDDGTVPTLEAYEKCARELMEAEKLLESLGYRRVMDGEWEAPMPGTQFQRDMKVAEAVRGWYERQYPDVAMRIVQPDLEHIIRGVK